MKKAATKSAFHRGFTLIELMIVIVILGILMGTILPRLSGAQGRARDTGRVADLNTIAQALELYYDDFGRYPNNTTAGTPDCIESGDLGDFDLFSTYFKGNIVPAPPGELEVTEVDGVTCTGSYLYMALVSKGAPNQAYAVVANTETATKGNFIVPNSGVTVPSGGSLTYDSATTIGDVVDAIAAAGASDLITADSVDDSGQSTLYILAN